MYTFLLLFRSVVFLLDRSPACFPSWHGWRSKALSAFECEGLMPSGSIHREIMYALSAWLSCFRCSRMLSVNFLMTNVAASAEYVFLCKSNSWWGEQLLDFAFLRLKPLIISMSLKMRIDYGRAHNWLGGVKKKKPTVLKDKDSELTWALEWRWNISEGWKQSWIDGGCWNRNRTSANFLTNGRRDPSHGGLCRLSSPLCLAPLCLCSVAQWCFISWRLASRLSPSVCTDNALELILIFLWECFCASKSVQQDVDKHFYGFA